MRGDAPLRRRLDQGNLTQPFYQNTVIYKISILFPQFLANCLLFPQNDNISHTPTLLSSPCLYLSSSTYVPQETSRPSPTPLPYSTPLPLPPRQLWVPALPPPIPTYHTSPGTSTTHLYPTTVLWQSFPTYFIRLISPIRPIRLIPPTPL